MLYLLFGLIVMPIVVLATLGGDVTWFTMFACEAAVVVLYFVMKKFFKNKPSATSYKAMDLEGDIEGYYSRLYTYRTRAVPPMFEEDK